jgi:hypothetical protein
LDILFTNNKSHGKKVNRLPFSEENIFLEINQSETIISFGGHVFKWIRTKYRILREDLP